MITTVAILALVLVPVYAVFLTIATAPRGES